MLIMIIINLYEHIRMYEAISICYFCVFLCMPPTTNKTLLRDIHRLYYIDIDNIIVIYYIYV